MVGYKASRERDFRLIGILVLTILFMVGSASAATLTVDDSGGAMYTKIQDAINAGSNGDTILVYSGTYYENVDVNKQLILRGIDTGSGKPVVDSSRSGFAITLSGGQSTLEGFIATNSSSSSITLAGILVRSHDNILKNNTANLNGAGIFLDSSSNNILSNNNVNSNSNYGISLHYSSNNVLTDNNITNTGHGVFFYYSTNNILNNNNISSNWDGITLSVSSYNTVINNTVNSNQGVGIAIYSSYLYPYGYNTINNNNISSNYIGIYLSSSWNNILINNNISSNFDGIYIESSDNNTITNNAVLNNIKPVPVSGIHLEFSNNNKIYLNNFINNGDNIYSYKSTNIWNSTDKITYAYKSSTFTNYLGNYWSDYIGSDADGNGIGDTPYNIDSDKDNYPLIKPWENYFAPTPPPENQPPIASFTYTPQNPMVSEEIIFDASLSSDPDGEIVSYTWDFGDGIMGTRKTAMHSYNGGIYTVTLTVTDDREAKSSISKKIKVRTIDLKISNITPVQVVFNADINNDGKIDLVQGKAAAIFVYVEGFEELSDNIIINVNLTFEEKTNTESKTVAELKQDKRIIFYATPRKIGDQTLVAKVDPFDEIREIDETNNTLDEAVTVKDTDALHLAYIPVYAHLLAPWGTEPPWGYGPLDMTEYPKTAERSNKFIKYTYPISEEEFVSSIITTKYYGDPVPSLGMLDDALSVWTWGKLDMPSADRVIGVVPEDYFSFHLRDGIGVYFGIPGVLVRVDTINTAAHEIGHSYGLNLKWPLGPGEEYDTNPPGNPAKGFWVEQEMPIENAVCFMGAAPEVFPGTPITFEFRGVNYFYSDGVWVSNKTYKELFEKLKVGSDPEILLLTGIAFKNGTVSLKKWYWLPNGTVDYIIPGNNLIQFVGFDGKVLSSISFYSGFEMYIDPIGIIETNFSGFAFAIPYPENTSKILITINQSAIEVNPNTKLLHDAIDSIPNHGFINNPEQRRNALHHKIDAVEKMLEKNNTKGAIEKLRNDIRDKLEKWLIDYNVENPSQLTKDQVIDLVDEMIYRLSRQIF